MDSLRRRGAQFYDWDAKNRPIGFILWFRTIFMHDVRIGSVVMVNTSFSEKDASETQQTFPEAFIVFGPPNRPRPRPDVPDDRPPYKRLPEGPPPEN